MHSTTWPPSGCKSDRETASRRSSRSTQGVPAAYEGSIIAAELGTVVIGSLITSTLLTLIVVPVVYLLVDGLKRRLTRSRVEATA